MPLTTHFPLAAGASHVSEGQHQDYIEVDVAQYSADGSVNKKAVMLTMDEANELKERLISAKTFEDRFFILKEYGLIMKESNALYVISGEAHLGLPPIIGLTKFLGSSRVISFDLADMCWGAFGMVETKGLLRTHTMAAVASFMALAGFSIWPPSRC